MFFNCISKAEQTKHSMVSVWYKVTGNESNGEGCRDTRVGGAWIVWDPRKTSTFTQIGAEIHRLWAGNIHHDNVDSRRIPVAMWGGQAAERSKQKLVGSCFPRRCWARDRGSSRCSDTSYWDGLAVGHKQTKGSKKTPGCFVWEVGLDNYSNLLANSLLSWYLAQTSPFQGGFHCPRVPSIRAVHTSGSFSFHGGRRNVLCPI